MWDFKSNSRQTLKDLTGKYLNGKLPDFDNFLDTYNQVNDQLWEKYRNGDVTKEYLRLARFSITFQQLGVEDTGAIEKISQGYLVESPIKTGLFPYSYEILEYLQEKGYDLYLLTNGFSEVQTVKIKNCKLEPYFKRMITSEQSGYQKPNRKMFEYAMKTVNAKKAHSIMIGDDLQADILGAKVFGIDQVWFNPENKRCSLDPTYQVNSLIELKLIL